MPLPTGIRQLARGPWVWSLLGSVQQAIWMDDERRLVRYYRPGTEGPLTHVAEASRPLAVRAIQEDADDHWERLWNGLPWVLT